jgi:structure-specific recognition protein 1
MTIEEDEQHEEEEEEVVVPAKVVVKQRKPRKKKDPNAPATPLSAYAFFFRDSQAKIKSVNPAAKFGDISRSVASMWETLVSHQEKPIK